MENAGLSKEKQFIGFRIFNMLIHMVTCKEGHVNSVSQICVITGHYFVICLC